MIDPAHNAAPACRTVLLVDDDARVRRALTQLLHWTGAWRVIGEAADAQHALAVALALRPELVLLDLWLDKGNGLHLLTQLRAVDPPPCVCVLTVESAAAVRDLALACGAAAYVLKTAPPQELLAVLQALAAAL